MFNKKCFFCWKCVLLGSFGFIFGRTIENRFFSMKIILAGISLLIFLQTTSFWFFTHLEGIRHSRMTKAPWKLCSIIRTHYWKIWRKEAQNLRKEASCFLCFCYELELHFWGKNVLFGRRRIKPTNFCFQHKNWLLAVFNYWVDLTR